MQSTGPLGLAGSGRGRAIMHSNSQLKACFASLALRRAAHDCITGDGSSGAALRLYLVQLDIPPQTPEETSKTYLLMAQFKFEQHACLNIRRSGLNGPPEQPSPKDPERRT